MRHDSNIYIAGHRGLVGSAIHRRLQHAGYTNLITRSYQELDLERQAEAEAFFQSVRPEYVFLAAAKVGGIWANASYPAEFIYSNVAIQTNVIHASWKTGVERLVFLGSSCIYPGECPQPMREEHLLTGPLEVTNQPYAVAKIAGVIQCEAYNRQYGTSFLAVMPTNLYGPNDNFDLESSHVLPALIRKFHLAKFAAKGDWDTIAHDESRFGSIPADLRSTLGLQPPTTNLKRMTPKVILWGTGTPRREFLHVDDLADACLFLMVLDDERFEVLRTGGHLSGEPLAVSHEPSAMSDEPRERISASNIERSGPQAKRSSSSAKRLTPSALPLINIGSGQDQTIRELASVVARVVGFEGGITWDTDRPDGTPRKLLDVSRLRALGWSPTIDLETGIRSTYEWYLSQT
jgi:GDP-L-fucose synthase